MSIEARILRAIAVLGFAALAQTAPAQALTVQECSAKYQAAKVAGTLNGQKWNDFRKAQCGLEFATSPPYIPPPALPSTLSPALPSTGNRVALVIGNSAYQKVPALPNPVNDANDISQSLTRLGFAVQTVTNASFDDMRRSIISFGRSAQSTDIAVVFFAGHGMEIGGENWLIPIDAELRSDTDAESEAVNLKTVVLQVSKATKLGLVILDACRNNPFAAKMQRSIRVRSVDRGFARTEPLENVLVAYSAKDGTTAADGNTRNSPFTAALLRNIQTPGLEVRFLFAHVRDDVMAATNREQQPFIYGSLSSEEIYFRMPDSRPEISAPSFARPPVPTIKPTETPAQAAAPNDTTVVPAAKTPIFPSAVDPKYSNETDGNARMHTCLDQYIVNKDGSANAGMKWIEKGGGYYSECNRRLKG